MRQRLSLIVIIFTCSCSLLDNRANYRDVDISEFYLPLNEDFESLSYHYQVINESENGKKISDEYHIITNLHNGKFSFSKYDSNMDLLDSAVISPTPKGVEIDELHIKPNPFLLTQAFVEPAMIYPWKRTTGEELTNMIFYDTVLEGSQASIDTYIESDFIGYQNFENVISDSTRCAHLKLETSYQILNRSTGEELEFNSETEIYNLKGVGLYKSIESYENGDRTIKELKLIKKTAHNNGS